MAANVAVQPGPAPVFPDPNSAIDVLDDDPVIRNQDDAEAVLQPALSDMARHLASQNTPAIEKVAALEKKQGGGLFEVSSDGEGDSSSEPASPDASSMPSPPTQLTSSSVPSQVPHGQLPSRDSLPSPWQAKPKEQFQHSPRPSGGALKSITRHRSTSAGQEALRRLSRAFPSLSAPSSLLPSIPSSFRSSSPDKTGNASQQTNLPASAAPSKSRTMPPSGTQMRSQLSPDSAARRPCMHRRVTSDDNLLYHSLSRASSLGDDDRFQDVHEMVNIRLMAIKDSLPDVPNFKIPSLPKFYTQAMKSTLSLHTTGSTDALGAHSQNSHEVDADPKDPVSAIDRALNELTGDVVIMGGYRGSVLRSAEPPHQQLWAPVKIGLNMRKANLEVGLEDEDELRMEETIIPSGMLDHIGPVDVSRKLIKKLRGCDNARAGKLRVWDFGYDWRLSPPLLSQRLQEFLQKLPCNQPGVASEARGALVIPHSLGGVITRHAVNQRPDLFSGVLFAGTPQRCINILNPMRHGDVVLLNEKILTAQVNFSIRTSFVFLPEDGYCFVDKNTGEEYPIDFYNPHEWEKWHLSPCLAPTLPNYNRPHSSSLSSLLPNPLRTRSDSKAERPPSSHALAKNRNPLNMQLNGTGAQQDHIGPSNPERERYIKYLTRTLAMTRKFRSELVHLPTHQDANAYPPLAVLYGKSIPTVFAAQVSCREAIRCNDAYDDLLFRPGDGVVLAKEAMLPNGYALVRGGRQCTERGHINMLSDLPAVGRALEALIRGRRKGIGLGAGGNVPNEDAAK